MASRLSNILIRTLSAAACGAVLFAAVPAIAGECPADKVKPGVRTTGETMPKGVKDEVLSAIDLSSKGKEFEGYMLRLRRLTVDPGGVVPWHKHDERAANILILEGTVVEYSSNCDDKIVHNAGDVVAEFAPDLAHWWMNESDKPVVILSGDLLPPTMAPKDAM